MTDAAKPRLRHKILHTFSTLVFAQISSIAAGIATAHAFGPAGRGILALAMILLFFGVTTADGVRNAVATQVGREGIAQTLAWGTARRLMAFIAPIGVAVFLALWRTSGENIAFLFAAIGFPVALYVQSVGILYQLGDRIEKINVQNTLTIGGGISIVTLAMVTLLHVPLATILWTTIAAYCAAALWASLGVRELIGGTPAFGGWRLLREQAFFGSKVALSSGITLFALRVDVFIVGAMSAPASLGIYTLALSTGEVLYNVSKAVLWSATGRIASLPQADSAALCARTARTLVAAQFVAALVLFAVGPRLITLVYGHRFEGSGNVLRLLLPGIIFYSADGIFSYFIAVKSGRPGALLVMECVTLVVTAAVTYAAIARIGIYAGALAHTVAFLISYAVKSTMFVRLTGIPYRDVLFVRRSDARALLVLRRRARPTG